MTREEALKILSNRNGFGIPTGYTSGYAEAIDLAIEALKAEPKHGRWKPVTNGRGGFECSVCTNYAPSYQDGVEWLSRFCPTCGTRMDFEEVENG